MVGTLVRSYTESEIALAITDYTIYATCHYYTEHAQTDADNHVPNNYMKAGDCSPKA